MTAAGTTRAKPLLVLALLLLNACSLPPTRRSRTVWAEPLADLEQTHWVLSSLTCGAGQQLAADTFSMSLHVRRSASGPLLLDVESKLFTCGEQLTLALLPLGASELFVLEERERQKRTGECTNEREPPRIVSFREQRRALTFRGALSDVCGNLAAEFVFVPGQS